MKGGTLCRRFLGEKSPQQCGVFAGWCEGPVVMARYSGSRRSGEVHRCRADRCAALYRVSWPALGTTKCILEEKQNNIVACMHYIGSKYPSTDCRSSSAISISVAMVLAVTVVVAVL